MDKPHQQYMYSTPVYKKINVWALVLSLISCLVMVLAMFVPYNELSAEKFVVKTMTQLREEVQEENKSLKEIWTEERVAAINFTACAIAGVDYPYKGTEDDVLRDSDSEADSKADSEKYEVVRAIETALNKSMYLLAIKDDEQFNVSIKEVCKDLSEYDRKVSVFELVVRITPETSLARIFNDNSNIFGKDAFGNILISLQLFIILMLMSVGLNGFNIVSAIINLINPDAAAKRYYNRCLGPERQKVNSPQSIKFQGTYLIPPYVFSYILALLIGLLPAAKSIFAKNICSCIPFAALIISPFAYVLIAVEAAVFFLSLYVNASKHRMRECL